VVKVLLFRSFYKVLNQYLTKIAHPPQLCATLNGRYEGSTIVERNAIDYFTEKAIKIHLHPRQIEGLSHAEDFRRVIKTPFLKRSDGR
jgi:hypothetical protein